jgi:hypothetical protein
MHCISVISWRSNLLTCKCGTWRKPQTYCKSMIFLITENCIEYTLIAKMGMNSQLYHSIAITTPVCVCVWFFFIQSTCHMWLAYLRYIAAIPFTIFLPLEERKKCINNSVKINKYIVNRSHFIMHVHVNKKKLRFENRIGIAWSTTLGCFSKRCSQNVCFFFIKMFQLKQFQTHQKILTCGCKTILIENVCLN